MVRSLRRVSGGGDTQKGIGQVMGGGDQGFGTKVQRYHRIGIEGFGHGSLPVAPREGRFLQYKVGQGQGLL